MKWSVCLDALFHGQDPAESMRLVKEAGIGAVEFWSWWDKDLTALNRAREKLGLKISAFCTRFESLVDQSRRRQYLQGLEETIAVAEKLGCKTLITQVGSELPDVPREQQHQSLVDGLKACVPVLEKSGITLVFEPLNILVDHKGYYLSHAEEAFTVASQVGSPHVRVLFDIYHQQITEGNLISTITTHIDQIGHFHAAGNPGRHELDIGEINYPEVFKAIEEADYRDYVGLEYFPVHNTMDGLRKLL